MQQSSINMQHSFPISSEYNKNFYPTNKINENEIYQNPGNILSYSTETKKRPNSVYNYTRQSNNSKRSNYSNRKINEMNKKQEDFENINAEYYQEQIDKLTKKYGNLDDIDEEQLRNFIKENFKNEQMQLLTKENNGFITQNQNYNTELSQKNYIERTVGDENEIPSEINIKYANQMANENNSQEGNLNEMEIKDQQENDQGNDQDDIEINNEDVEEEEMYNENFN